MASVPGWWPVVLLIAAPGAWAPGTVAMAEPVIVAADPAADGGAAGWAVEVSGYGYFIPDDDDYLQPTVTADRGRLHLEARYNYEDEDTASLWLGGNFGGGGDELEWELTPMLGVVLGATDGVAPGLKGWLGWRWLELSAEVEYVIDSGDGDGDGDGDGNFLYAWSELSVAPREWWRVGVVGQRTRAYDTELDVQRGLLLGVAGERWSVTGYLFNPDKDDEVLVVGGTLGF